MWNSFKEVSRSGNCVGVTSPKIFDKNHSSRWQLPCVKLSSAFIQKIILKIIILFCFQQVLRKTIVRQDYCMSTHVSFFFLEVCKFYLIVLGTSLNQSFKSIKIITLIKKLFASAQTLGSAFLDRIRKGQNSKNETDLFKKLGCFIDDHGSGQRDYVSFVMS